jgi:hypothetical protein
MSKQESPKIDLSNESIFKLISTQKPGSVSNQPVQINAPPYVVPVQEKKDEVQTPNKIKQKPKTWFQSINYVYVLFALLFILFLALYRIYFGAKLFLDKQYLQSAATLSPELLLITSAAL